MFRRVLYPKFGVDAEVARCGEMKTLSATGTRYWLSILVVFVATRRGLAGGRTLGARPLLIACRSAGVLCCLRVTELLRFFYKSSSAC